MKLDVESLMKERWIGVSHAILIILSFGLPWAYPEDYGNTVSVFGLNLTTGSDLQRFGDVMGFMMTTAIMVTAAVYLWKRWRNTQGTKTSITLFTLVLLYPIIASGSLEHIWLGYLVTLLLTAPIPTLMFINWGHQKLEPHGGIQAVIKNTYNNIYGRLGRNKKAPQP